jgi:CheY-like chemotaxis protein
MIARDFFRHASLILRYSAFCVALCLPLSVALAQQPVQDPVVRNLLATNPTAPENIIRVVMALIDLRQPAAAQGLMKQLSEMPLEDETLIALHKEYGSSVFVKLALQPALAPLGKQFADRVFEATNKRARDPERLKELVTRLGNPSPGLRAAAARDLLEGGDAAARVLAEALADDSRQPEAAGVQAVLTMLGKTALPEMNRLLRSENSAVVLRAIAVLGQMSSEESEFSLLAPAFAVDSPVAVKHAAIDALFVRRSEINSATRAAARLYVRAESLFAEKRNSAGDLQQALIWAHDAQRILPDNDEIRRLALYLRVALPVKSEVSPLDGSSIEEVESLLAEALKRNDADVADIALGQLSVKMTADRLLHHAPNRSVVVEAVRHSNRRISKSALFTIGQLAPSEAYPGDSEVIEALGFYLRSRGVKRAIVADVRTDKARLRAGMLMAEGYEAEIADDERSLLQLATSMPDCKLILIDMSLAARFSGKVISDLRNDARTTFTPIGITATTTRFDRAEALAQQHSRVVAFIDAPIPQASKQWARELAALSGSELESSVDDARMAIDWLVTAKQLPKHVPTLRSLERELAEAVYEPNLGNAAMTLLAEVGTPTSQSLLVGVAGSGLLPLQMRQAAATAFGYSVQRFGTLLTTGEIAAAYDRYNASQYEEQAAQKLLGSILDYIEARVAIDAGEKTNSAQPRPEEVPSPEPSASVPPSRQLQSILQSMAVRRTLR